MGCCPRVVGLHLPKSLRLAQDKKPVKLTIGTTVSLNEIEYLVEEPIGRGGFGSVFKVSRSNEAAIA